jgi:hypothetical protein
LKLFSALYAFYQSLFSRDCDHPYIQPGKKAQAPFCPDCGYKVACAWMQVKCRDCDSRLLPRKLLDGKIKPMMKHCAHCGSKDFKLVQVEAITSHELYLSVAVKTIDYTEERKSFISGGANKSMSQTMSNKIPPVQNPFESKSSPFDVVDGQVLRTRYYSQSTQSAWDEAPFFWGNPSQAQKPYTQKSNPFALPEKSTYPGARSEFRVFK